MNRGLGLFLIGFLLFSSCIPKKSFYYFQKSGKTQIKDSIFTEILTTSVPEHSIAINDVLEIKIEEANLVTKSEVATDKAPTVPTYAVDSKGMITLPLVGIIAVSGKTCRQIHDTLLHVYQRYYKDPYVSVALKSFRISVLGEVRMPGIKILEGENATILDALGMSNDLTDEGKRINIKLFRRTSDNQYKQIMLDLSSIDVFNSEGYHLKSNDIIYVSSINAKRTFARSNVLTLGVTLFNTILILYRSI